MLEIVLLVLAALVLVAVAIVSYLRKNADQPRLVAFVGEPQVTPSLIPPPEEDEPSFTDPKLTIRDGGIEIDEPTASFACFLYEHAAQSDVGKRRPVNEDRFVCLPEHGIFAVLDGMGGEAAGEVASRLAAEVLTAAFDVEVEPSELNVEVPDDLPRGSEELVCAILRANRRIRREQRTRPELRGMGTTIVVMRLAPRKNRTYVAHVGDSRAYRLREGDLAQLTRDHTMASVAGATGDVGGRLAWALGTEHDVTVEVQSFAPEVGDRYLLCSDGLTKLVSDQEISDILASERDRERCAARLIARANDEGGIDNVTVVIVDVISVAGRI